MFFEGGNCRLRITPGDAVELLGPSGYVGLYVPLPTGLRRVGLFFSQFNLSADEGLFSSLRLDLGFKLAFVGMVQPGTASQVVCVRFHCFTPRQERCDSDEVNGVLLLVAGRDDRDERVVSEYITSGVEWGVLRLSRLDLFLSLAT